MKLTTPVNYSPINRFAITTQSRIVSLGSCFSENIGNELHENGFKTLVNPFGVIFNPISIARLLVGENLLNHITAREGKYVSLDCHSKVFGEDQLDLEKKINAIQIKLKDELKVADLLIITFGTAWVYKKEGRVVANCHKQPQTNFTKELLTIDEVRRSYQAVIKELKEINPKLKIVFTVSPVRHSKDGMIENTRSKSRLIEAVHTIKSEFDNVEYFPAFEIMNDELRDYRFYKDDMLHPSELAVNIIFEAFSNAFLSARSREIHKKYQKLNQLKSHRSILSENSFSEKIKHLQNEIERLQLNEEQPSA